MPIDLADGGARDALRRAEFPWSLEGRTVYLNAASTGPLPERAIAAESALTRRRAQPDTISVDEQFGILAHAREAVARLIGASADEVALAPNTGAGLNLVAWGLPLGSGDVVVIPDREFPANVYPWLAAAEARGYTVRRVTARPGQGDEEGLIAALDDGGVRVLSVSWVSFATGSRLDLHRLGAACRARDVIFVVDAIQGIGALTIDVRRTPVDLLACGAQKWLLGPWGTGFTYVHPALLPRLAPQPVSWMAVRGSDDFSRLLDYDPTWRPNARRFEPVTLAYQAFAGLGASLSLLHEIGAVELERDIGAHARRFADAACERGHSLVTRRDSMAGIVSLRVGDAERMSTRLARKGIVHSLREGVLRFAPHCYTTDDQLGEALEALDPDPQH